MKQLEGKVSIVTGGSRGIGRVIVERFLQSGAKVVVCSRNEEELEKSCQEIDREGSRLFPFVADVSKLSDCRKLVRQAMKLFGRVDILVNNAGIYGPIGPIEKNSIRHWRQTLNINLLGAVNLAKLVVPIMKSQGEGKIINLAGAGVGGKRALARFSAYYTSKASVVAFSECLAQELVEDNIQVNCISPGAVYTHFTDYLIAQGAQKAGQKAYEDALQQRSGKSGNSPLLAAKLVVFLSSEGANKISGRILSAVWDKIEDLSLADGLPEQLYKIRRIDDRNFYEKK